MEWNEDLERIALQERELQLPRLDAEIAWELGSSLRTMAAERRLAIVIDVRRFGQPLFYAAMDGTTPDNVEWVRRKSNVVARFHRSSYAVGLKEKTKNESLLESQGLAAHRLRHPRRLVSLGRRRRGCSRQRNRLRPPEARGSRTRRSRRCVPTRAGLRKAATCGGIIHRLASSFLKHRNKEAIAFRNTPGSSRR